VGRVNALDGVVSFIGKEVTMGEDPLVGGEKKPNKRETSSVGRQNERSNEKGTTLWRKEKRNGFYYCLGDGSDQARR